MILVQHAQDELLHVFHDVRAGDEKTAAPFVYIRDNEASLLRDVLFLCDAAVPLPPGKTLELGRAWLQVRDVLHPAFSLYAKQYLLRRYQQKNNTLRRLIKNMSTVELLGANHGLQQVVQRMRMLAPTDISILITGETGTGKEVVARSIHGHSLRAGRPFVAVNCGGIAPALLESALFGHVRGAFTDAVSDHAGLIEKAQGGTLFLDEIGELPLEGQTKLLRVLQDRLIRRVGGTRAIHVDIRIIAATNRDLSDMIRHSGFRSDLYYRLCGASIHIPPLRERTQDIPLLVQHYMTVISRNLNVVEPPLAEGEMERLMEYSWPGNVRELINVISVGIACCGNTPVRFSLPHGDDAFLPPPSGEGVASYGDMARRYLSEVLRQCRGQISGPLGAATLAGVPQSTFRSMLKRFHVEHDTRKGNRT